MNPGNSFGIISKQIGSLLKLLGIVIAISSLVSAIYGELYSFLGFLLSGFIILSLGMSLRFFFRKSEDIHYKQALIVVAASWLVLTFAGGLPFYIIAYITPEKIIHSYIPENSGYEISSLYYFRNYLHCFFESMSAFTTTGLSMAVHEPSVGKGVLFYRSFAQWIGGAGFIIMVLAIFREISGKGAILLYGSESTGEKLQPKVISTARSIWKVYVIVTLFSFVYLSVGTSIILPDYPLASNIFDSLNHAMAGQSTGGFSVLDDSIAGYQSPSMDMLYLLPMILGSFSLPFFYKVIVFRKFGQFWHDIQTRYLIFAFICGSVIQSLLLLRADSVPEPFREGVFQFISGMSSPDGKRQIWRNGTGFR